MGADPSQNDRSVRVQSIPWLTFVLVVFAGLAGATALAQVQQGGWPSQGQEYALAIERGVREGQQPPLDAEAIKDEAISHNARQAGYRWAERNDLNDLAKCAPLPDD
jgi:hypothetical protein